MTNTSKNQLRTVGVPPTRRIERLVLLVASIGMFLSTLDTGIINIALPFLKATFSTTTTLAALSVSGYMMSLAAIIMLFGLLADKLGKLKISLLGFLIFGLSSLLCGFSVNVGMLIALRIVQGVGAAAMQATTIALITTFVSKERLHTALGTLGIAIGLGPVLGPSVGGLFLALGDWRWIFWLNVPIVALAVGVNLYLLKWVKEKRQVRTIDSAGVLLVILVVVGLLSGLSVVKSTLALGLALIVFSLLLLLALLGVEKRKEQPLLSLAVYRRSSGHLGLYLTETAVFGFASAMVFLLPPFILEQTLGVSAGLAGLFVLGTPVGLVVFSKLSGRWNKGSRSRLFTRFGLGLMLLSVLLFLLLHSALIPLLVTALLFVYGVGGGFLQPANIALISGAVPPTIQGEIGSLQRMVQNLGIALGTTVGAVILAAVQTLSEGVFLAWALTGGVLVFVVAVDFAKKLK